MDCTTNDSIKYILIGYQLGYGQPNPSWYWFMVDDRMKTSEAKKAVLNRYSWLKVYDTEIIFFDSSIKPFRRKGEALDCITIDGAEYKIWGYITRKEN